MMRLWGFEMIMLGELEGLGRKLQTHTLVQKLDVLKWRDYSLRNCCRTFSGWRVGGQYVAPAQVPNPSPRHPIVRLPIQPHPALQSLADPRNAVQTGQGDNIEYSHWREGAVGPCDLS